MDKESCDCVQRTSYGLPCACFIAIKICDNKPILLDEIHRNWHRLCTGEESNGDGFSAEEEWNGVQERLKKVPYQMMLEIKEVFAAVGISRHHSVVSTTTKSTNQRSQEKSGNCEV